MGKTFSGLASVSLTATSAFQRKLSKAVDTMALKFTFPLLDTGPGNANAFFADTINLVGDANGSVTLNNMGNDDFGDLIKFDHVQLLAVYNRPLPLVPNGTGIPTGSLRLGGASGWIHFMPTQSGLILPPGCLYWFANPTGYGTTIADGGSNFTLDWVNYAGGNLSFDLVIVGSAAD